MVGKWRPPLLSFHPLKFERIGDRHDLPSSAGLVFALAEPYGTFFHGWSSIFVDYPLYTCPVLVKLHYFLIQITTEDPIWVKQKVQIKDINQISEEDGLTSVRKVVTLLS
ncbi:hypothetical protein L1987_58008 [Smallanthus sonchifolius]|uniref:Uncharacterized protein n=1 Tax=Smallanthus sonchifolius TaxID=185202 RepID=A0ACB9DEQ9_9ASTR|nr:hypothetical protein L1987_58008 [Smallanthus sonchifolius]